MPAFLLIVIELLRYGKRRKGPIADIRNRLFDHIIGARQ